MTMIDRQNPKHFEPVTPTQDPVVCPPIPTYDARAMIPSGTQAHIALDGQVYTLRITRAGKLILTK